MVKWDLLSLSDVSKQFSIHPWGWHQIQWHDFWRNPVLSISTEISKMTTDLGICTIQHGSVVISEILHWTVCWPWLCYVRRRRVGRNRWKATLRSLSSRRVAVSQPTLGFLTRMWCQNKRQCDCHENLNFHHSFTSIWNDFASHIPIEISQSCDDNCFHGRMTVIGWNLLTQELNLLSWQCKTIFSN